MINHDVKPTRRGMAFYFDPGVECPFRCKIHNLGQSKIKWLLNEIFFPLFFRKGKIHVTKYLTMVMEMVMAYQWVLSS